MKFFFSFQNESFRETILFFFFGGCFFPLRIFKLGSSTKKNWTPLSFYSKTVDYFSSEISNDCSNPLFFSKKENLSPPPFLIIYNERKLIQSEIYSNNNKWTKIQYFLMPIFPTWMRYKPKKYFSPHLQIHRLNNISTPEKNETAYVDFSNTDEINQKNIFAPICKFPVKTI